MAQTAPFEGFDAFRDEVRALEAHRRTDLLAVAMRRSYFPRGADEEQAAFDGAWLDLIDEAKGYAATRALNECATNVGDVAADNIATEVEEAVTAAFGDKIDIRDYIALSLSLRGASDTAAVLRDIVAEYSEKPPVDDASFKLLEESLTLIAQDVIPSSAKVVEVDDTSPSL
ncbi:MAG: hypothetical protein V2I24_14965 [Halieaceae bacterium]|nr:hypothetical protein [Halieaceae bacterium]